jgi:hypothetical protein
MANTSSMDGTAGEVGRLLKRARRVLFITGAGVSAESHFRFAQPAGETLDGIMKGM